MRIVNDVLEAVALDERFTTAGMVLVGYMIVRRTMRATFVRQYKRASMVKRLDPRLYDIRPTLRRDPSYNTVVFLIKSISLALLAIWRLSIEPVFPPPPEDTNAWFVLLTSLAAFLALVYAGVLVPLQRWFGGWWCRNVVKGPAQYLHALHLTRGEKLVRLGTKDYSLNDPKYLGRIYGVRTGDNQGSGTSTEPYAKSDAYAAFDVDGQSTIFSMRDPHEHGRRVKAVRHLFSPANVRRRQHVIDAASDRFVEHACDLAAEDDGVLDILSIARGFALQSITEFAFDQPYVPYAPQTSPFAANSTIPIDKQEKDRLARISRRERTIGRQFGLALDHINRSAKFGRSTHPIIRFLDTVCEPFAGKEYHRKPAGTDEALAAYDTYVARIVDCVLAETRPSQEGTSSTDDIASDSDQDQEFHYAKLLRAKCGLDRKALTAEVSDIIFAGVDSTATTLATGIYHLYRRPEVLTAYRASLQLQQRDSAHKDATSTAASTTSVGDTFTTAIVNESLRIATPVPRLLPRRVAADDDIFIANDDVLQDDWLKVVPSNSNVGISAYALHHDERVWGSWRDGRRGAEAYWPARWMSAQSAEKFDRLHIRTPSTSSVDDQNHHTPTETNDNLKRRLQRQRDSFIPFGKSARACIGQNLARLELSTFIDKFAGRFDPGAGFATLLPGFDIVDDEFPRPGNNDTNLTTNTTASRTGLCTVDLLNFSSLSPTTYFSLDPGSYFALPLTDALNPNVQAQAQVAVDYLHSSWTHVMSVWRDEVSSLRAKAIGYVDTLGTTHATAEAPSPSKPKPQTAVVQHRGALWWSHRRPIFQDNFNATIKQGKVEIDVKPRVLQ
ncbi:hypothetical protein PYCC9005_001849 [Savitreella phatthalungensis]